MESLTQIERESETGSNLLVEAGPVRVEKLRQVAEVLNQIFRNVMQEGTDFGTIPGTPKPSLWKPGAELLANYFGLVPGEPQITDESDYRIPYFAYRVKIPFRDRLGRELGFGEAACNSREFKYAYRKIWEGQGFDAEKLKLTEELRKQVVQKKDRYYIPTPPYDIYDYQNTVLKIAKKRAFVDGVSSITGASRIFTQDLDEDEEQKASAAKPVGSGAAKPAASNSNQGKSSSPQKMIKYFETSDKKYVKLPRGHPLYDEFAESCAAIVSDHPEIEYEMRSDPKVPDSISSVMWVNVPKGSDVEKSIDDLIRGIADGVGSLLS